MRIRGLPGADPLGGPLGGPPGPQPTPRSAVLNENSSALTELLRYDVLPATSSSLGVSTTACRPIEERIKGRRGRRPRTGGSAPPAARSSKYRVHSDCSIGVHFHIRHFYVAHRGLAAYDWEVDRI